MFLAAKNQYSPTKNEFNSSNTDEKSKSKCKNVSFSVKKLNSLRVSLVLLGEPSGKAREPLKEN